ncbi:helix-turn-helix domain-containing protein [Niastella koreensis]|nr:helix-turn-helix domain-containing protein [Niastella koreensis]
MDDVKLFHAIKVKIEKDFKEKLPYHNLVRTFCVNDHELRHGFVHFFGQSIREYQEQLRVQYACELMRQNPGMSVLKIAYDAGFNERSTFYRAFGRLLCMAPGEWRKQNKKHRKTDNNENDFL